MKSISLSEVGHVLVCGEKSCKKESKALRKALATAAEETKGRVLVLKASSVGCGEKGPAVVVWPKGILFEGAVVSDVAAILAAAGWEAPYVNPVPAAAPEKKKTKKTTPASKPTKSVKVVKPEKATKAAKPSVKPEKAKKAQKKPKAVQTP